MEFKVNPPPALTGGDVGLPTKATQLGMKGLGEGRGSEVCQSITPIDCTDRGFTVWGGRVKLSVFLPTQPEGFFPAPAVPPAHWWDCHISSFLLYQGDTVLTLLVNAIKKKSFRSSPACLWFYRMFGQGARGEERKGERNQLVHTNLPGKPVSKNLSIANCNLLVCPPQVSYY